MENTNSLEKKYQEVVTESMKNIIGENAKQEVRNLLREAEDEDSYSEEDVDDTEAVNDEEVDTEQEIGDDSMEEPESSEDEGEDAELWNDLENCKSADGEYDCRGMDDGKLLKVLKAMGPEDGIRVMSNGDGTVNVEVDGDLIDGTAEYVIDIDDFDVDSDDLEDYDDEDEDSELEVEIDESKVNCNYTDDYQHDTAMTTLDNHEPANPKTTYSMDAGVPKGTEKPWAQDGDRKPYKDNVDEDVDECGDTIFEVEEDGGEEIIDEVMSTTENNPTVRDNGMTHANNNIKGKKFRSSSEGGSRVKGTGYNSYSGETNESYIFKKKVNRLWEENKQMKSIIPELNKKLMESMVINASMGYIVRLLNENTTTVDEKKRIRERFSKVNTLEEGKKLYETISEELSSVNKQNNVNGIINSQLAEGKQNKQNLVETTMYKSEKVNETLDFMKRLDAIK